MPECSSVNGKFLHPPQPSTTESKVTLVPGNFPLPDEHSGEELIVGNNVFIDAFHIEVKGKPNTRVKFYGRCNQLGN